LALGIGSHVKLGFQYSENTYLHNKLVAQSICLLYQPPGFPLLTRLDAKGKEEEGEHS